MTYAGASVIRALPWDLKALSLAMGFPAAKGTTQVATAGIARIGQEENAAVPAPAQAGSQTGLGVQNRSQQQIMLQHQGGHCAPRCRSARNSKTFLAITSS